MASFLAPSFSLDVSTKDIKLMYADRMPQAEPAQIIAEQKLQRWRRMSMDCTGLERSASPSSPQPEETVDPPRKSAADIEREKEERRKSAALTRFPGNVSANSRGMRSREKIDQSRAQWVANQKNVARPFTINNATLAAAALPRARREELMLARRLGSTRDRLRHQTGYSGFSTRDMPRENLAGGVNRKPGGAAAAKRLVPKGTPQPAAEAPPAMVLRMEVAKRNRRRARQEAAGNVFPRE
jgi:hypothetical protein